MQANKLTRRSNEATRRDETRRGNDMNDERWMRRIIIYVCLVLLLVFSGTSLPNNADNAADDDDDDCHRLSFTIIHRN